MIVVWTSTWWIGLLAAILFSAGYGVFVYYATKDKREAVIFSSLILVAALVLLYVLIPAFFPSFAGAE